MGSPAYVAVDPRRSGRISDAYEEPLGCAASALDSGSGLQVRGVAAARVKRALSH
jgi:hypothetical protein